MCESCRCPKEGPTESMIENGYKIARTTIEPDLILAYPTIGQQAQIHVVGDNAIEVVMIGISDQVLIEVLEGLQNGEVQRQQG